MQALHGPLVAPAFDAQEALLGARRAQTKGCVNKYSNFQTSAVNALTSSFSQLQPPPSNGSFSHPPRLLLHHDKCCFSVEASSEFRSEPVSACVFHFYCPGLKRRVVCSHCCCTFDHHSAYSLTLLRTICISIYSRIRGAGLRAAFELPNSYPAEAFTPTNRPSSSCRCPSHRATGLTTPTHRNGLQLRPSSSCPCARSRYWLSTVSTIPEWRRSWWACWPRRQGCSQSSVRWET